MESRDESMFLVGVSVVFVACHCCSWGGEGFLLYFGWCWGLWVLLVEVFDELWGKKVLFGDPLIV